MPKNKIIAIIAIAAAVGVFALFAFTYKKAGPDGGKMGDEAAQLAGEQAVSTTETGTATSTATTSEKADTTAVKPSTKLPGAASQSYTDALKTYSASGYRFQFVNCRPTPSSLVVKKGKTFMLDNRDNQAHRIKVGNTSYYVGAYGFAIATARTLGVNYVICDGGGSAKITVEP